MDEQQLQTLREIQRLIHEAKEQTERVAAHLYAVAATIREQRELLR